MEDLADLLELLVIMALWAIASVFFAAFVLVMTWQLSVHTGIPINTWLLLEILAFKPACSKRRD